MSFWISSIDSLDRCFSQDSDSESGANLRFIFFLFWKCKSQNMYNRFDNRRAWSAYTISVATIIFISLI